MIRELPMENVLVTVVLKNGEVYEKCDIPGSPTGEVGNLVCFWTDGKLRAYPIADIKYIDFIEGIVPPVE